MKNKTKKKDEKLQWRSFETVFKRASQRTTFQAAYEEEFVRLRLAHRLRDLREERQLTQQAMARQVGMPQSVIARLESGRQGISLDTLARVAHVLGKQVELV